MNPFRLFQRVETRLEALKGGEAHLEGEVGIVDISVVAGQANSSAPLCSLQSIACCLRNPVSYTIEVGLNLLAKTAVSRLDHSMIDVRCRRMVMLLWKVFIIEKHLKLRCTTSLCRAMSFFYLLCSFGSGTSIARRIRLTHSLLVASDSSAE